jgi:hypothetical protein
MIPENSTPDDCAVRPQHQKVAIACEHDAREFGGPVQDRLVIGIRHLIVVRGQHVDPARTQRTGDGGRYMLIHVDREHQLLRFSVRSLAWRLEDCRSSRSASTSRNSRSIAASHSAWFSK